MNERESRTLARTAVVLLVAGGVRWVAQQAGPAPPPPAAEAPSALEALDSAARVEADQEARARTPLAPGERLDPNRADVVELRRLPGVGPAVAAAMVASRDADGPFLAPDDLERVRGIGPATATRLEPLLDFSVPPPAWTLGRRAPADAGPVDLNQAGVDQLVRLPGIGPALAERIVESRRSQGPYRAADDLLRVRGVGPVLLERLRPLVRPAGG